MRSFFAPANLWVNVLFRVHSLDLLPEPSAIATGSSGLFSRFFKRFQGIREPPYCPLRPEDMAIIDEIPKASSVLQTLPARRDSFYLLHQGGVSTTINDAIHVSTEEDSGEYLTSNSETLLDRYRGVIKDAISSLPNDSGFPNSSTSPVYDATNTGHPAHNPSRSSLAGSTSTEQRQRRPGQDRASGSWRPRRKRSISHLEPGSSRPNLQRPTQEEPASDSNSITHSWDDKEHDLRGNDLPRSPGTVSRPNAIAQPDYLVQSDFLEGYSDIGHTRTEDEHHHHVDMSAFNVDMTDFLGNWAIDESEDTNLEDNHQLMPTFYTAHDPTEGGGENFDITES